MTVKELKELLQTLPDNMEVILQSDAEGNSYSPLSGGYDDAVYVPLTMLHGDVHFTDWTTEEAGMDSQKWNAVISKPRVLVLAPIG
ncbi:MAG: hypothetical protein ACJAZY_003224 [Spirosomataceae bacterium]|jgi:hypothetical protein